MTWWPLASITCFASSRSAPSAAIFSPVMPTSPVNVPAGVTTFPPLTILSNRMAQHLQRKVHVVRGNAHRRLDAQHVAIEPALANQQPHLLCRLDDVDRLGLG